MADMVSSSSWEQEAKQEGLWPEVKAPGSAGFMWLAWGSTVSHLEIMILEQF